MKETPFQNISYKYPQQKKNNNFKISSKFVKKNDRTHLNKFYKIRPHA